MKAEYFISAIIVLLVILGLGYLSFGISSLPEKTQSEIASPGYTEIPYKEIVNPAGFVNTGDKPIKIKDYVGKKVILLDIMTYSCINCQRTFPYVRSWYEKYKDEGFIAIGIHTPEFAFEKDKRNVEKAMREFGINFPIVLDNEYGTWNAYGNRYWPRKYLIDIHGNIVYDHIGEGAYDETEMKIKELLSERAKFLGETVSGNIDRGLSSSEMPEVRTEARSPETYFGSLRNEYLLNGTPGRAGEQTFVIPPKKILNSLYLGGTWDISPEHAKSVSQAVVSYRYSAKEVYIVASSSKPVEMEVWQDGKLVSVSKGEDVNDKGIVKIGESKLYKLIKNAEPGEHELELRIRGEGALLYAFTFG